MKVVYCKKEKYDVYIGRPSKWGNPYTHKTGTSALWFRPTREECISAYKEWMLNSQRGKQLLQQLHELEGKTLGCWCKPQSCHGDVLIELIKSNKNEISNNPTPTDSTNGG